MKNQIAQEIAVLGSTGSIGCQTLDVARFLGIKVLALAAAGGNLGLLLDQIRTFLPRIVAVADADAAKSLDFAIKGDNALKAALNGKQIEITTGQKGLEAAAAYSGVSTTVVAISGSSGFPAVISAIKAGKTIALANKETLVMAGKLVMALSRKHGAPILPVDGEHSAIFQCLQGRDRSEVKRLILTASGGPFYKTDFQPSAKITPEQASAHPVWKMGRKISIDSSTLMNKGFEVIEASCLFDMTPDMLDVVIHPQSIIHSMVEFRDNAILALMGAPDMRAPIQYALTYPARLDSLVEAVDFPAIGALTFEKPDHSRFPCLTLAYDALREGGTMPAVCNAANEAAVDLFIKGTVEYADIPRLIAGAMERHVPADDMVAENILEADREARENVLKSTG